MRKYTQEAHEEYRRKVDERATKEQEARNERMEKESARKAWIRDGGNAGDFDREWPSLRNQARRQRVVTADQKAREAMQASGVSRI